MRTDFEEAYLQTRQGQRANEILRSCVHCGFCNATCPTYQLTGDELDGPRGRIYLMREFLQTGANDVRTVNHLDRCLTCRACESTCPSGVAYAELAEIVRSEIGPRRDGLQGWLRRVLTFAIPEVRRLRRLVALGRWFRWMLPESLASHLKTRTAEVPRPHMTRPEKTVLLLDGCVQRVNTPATNAVLESLLASRGVASVRAPDEGCCGSFELHAGDEPQALERIRHNIDAIYPLLGGVEAVVSTASGCGVTVKDYGRLLAHDADYAAKARDVSDKTMDVSKYLVLMSGRGVTWERSESVSVDGAQDRVSRVDKVAWHSPCTLQHGQRVSGNVEKLLQGAGYELVPVRDAHLCCGSAGSYSILQPEMADKLRERKLSSLQQHGAGVIATANIGCQSHLSGAARVPVVHWIELLK